MAEGFSSYRELKRRCADQVVSLLEPIQHRYDDLSEDAAHVRRLLALGAEKATATADPVLARVRHAIGLFASL